MTNSDVRTESPTPQRPNPMPIQLMLTCLCDAFFGEVGIATVRVLEAAGCEVRFPDEQSCCGQPPFNAGDWNAARQLAARTRSVFSFDLPIVTPSASCAAMVREGYRMLEPDAPPMLCFELAEFLLGELKVDRWPMAPPGRRQVAFHRACHGRAIGLGDTQGRLLALAGFDLVPFAHPEQCCGFGGAFSVSHPAVSASVGKDKLKSIMEAGATEIVSGDMGCLMHLGGLIEREGLPLRTRHYAELLAEAL